jgi:hypothetical protein
VRKKRLAVLGLVVVGALALAAFGAFELSVRDRSDSGPSINLGSLRAALDSIPLGSLSEQEKSGLQATRVGAKLSRDLYIVFDSLWHLPAFSTNTFNERIHMDAAALMLTRYGLTDPTAGRVEGSFQDAQIQDLFRRFQEDGSRSAEAALQTMMYLEELDIMDIRTRLAQTDKEDLHLIYNDLLRGNALNLRDMAFELRSLGAPPYSPEFLGEGEMREILRGRPSELDDGSLLLRARVERCGKRDIGRLERRQRPDRPAVQPLGLRQRACSTQITISGEASRLVRVGPRSYRLRLLPTSLSIFPGAADSNSPAVWDGGKIAVFNSWDDALRSVGDDVSNLSEPVTVERPDTEPAGHVWLESIWRDPATSTYYGWYHLEPGNIACAPLTAPIVGAAVSTDGGLTWQDRGPVLRSAYDADCDYRNGFFVGGHGDFSVVMGPRGEYFYFMYSNYSGPVAEQGVAVARGRVADRGQPGTVMKYFAGGWTEPGLGGKVTPLLPSSTGWKGPHVESFWGPSVHWNSFLQSYVALLNRTDTADENWAQEGVYIMFSQDLVNWSSPEKILETNNWYPQVMGLGANGTDKQADRFMRVYVGGVSAFILEFGPS